MITFLNFAAQFLGVLLVLGVIILATVPKPRPKRHRVTEDNCYHLDLEIVDGFGRCPKCGTAFFVDGHEIDSNRPHLL